MKLLLFSAAWMSLGGFFCTDAGTLATGAAVYARQEQEPEAESNEEPDAKPKHRMSELQAATEELNMEDEADPAAPRKNGRQNARSVTRDGITTTTARDANREINIIEHPQTGIVVEVVRRYGPNDIDQLRQKHPELIDYVELFPHQLGDHEIELNLAIKSVYRAANPEQLKKLHPEAFNIYRRHRSRSHN